MRGDTNSKNGRRSWSTFGELSKEETERAAQDREIPF